MSTAQSFVLGFFTSLILMMIILLSQTVQLETRCFNGFLYVINDNNPRQMLDEQGRGVKCEES